MCAENMFLKHFQNFALHKCSSMWEWLSWEKGKRKGEVRRQRRKEERERECVKKKKMGDKLWKGDGQGNYRAAAEKWQSFCESFTRNKIKQAKVEWREHATHNYSEQVWLWVACRTSSDPKVMLLFWLLFFFFYLSYYFKPHNAA